MVDIGHLDAHANGSHRFRIARQRSCDEITRWIQNFIVHRTILVRKKRNRSQNRLTELVLEIARRGEAGIQHVERDGTADSQQESDDAGQRRNQALFGKRGRARLGRRRNDPRFALLKTRLFLGDLGAG